MPGPAGAPALASAARELFLSLWAGATAPNGKIDIKYRVWGGDGQWVPPLRPTGSAWDVWEGSEEAILLLIQNQSSTPSSCIC